MSVNIRARDLATDLLEVAVHPELVVDSMKSAGCAGERTLPSVESPANREAVRLYSEYL